jgi:hypothetical protein
LLFVDLTLNGRALISLCVSEMASVVRERSDYEQDKHQPAREPDRAGCCA